jgi:DNA-binding transcriptional regulator YhcF (GntR family)
MQSRATAAARWHCQNHYPRSAHRANRPRTPQKRESFLPPDCSLTVPLRDQVYAGLRAANSDGRLALGARLHASRAFARTLRVSRGTMNDAGRLIADGYVIGRYGLGTYVTYAPPAPPLDNRVELSRAVVRACGGRRTGPTT